MKFNKKGQGALEYLLLIGGAVLIAVIVIALLVGMGTSSRETAKDQADKAQQAMDVPQPASVVATVPGVCDTTAAAGTADANLQISWQPLGEGGTYTLHVEDNTGAVLSTRLAGGTFATGTILDPANTSAIAIEVDEITTSCSDSYSIYIETEKNNQTVTSNKDLFSW